MSKNEGYKLEQESKNNKNHYFEKGMGNEIFLSKKVAEELDKEVVWESSELADGIMGRD